MNTQDIIAQEHTYILQTYGRPDFVLERGEGVHLFNTDGNRYLDFVSGLGVNALGYGNPLIVETVKEQVERLIHCCNLYHSIHGPRLAELLVKHSFADRAFFCNSGTEAIEACLKFARRWGADRFSESKFRVLAMEDSFHGRTYGSLSATGQPKYQRAFGPMLPGIDFAQMNDLDSVKANVSEETCAILVEPVQIEGGVHTGTEAFLKGLRTLCDEQDMLLVFDEVQCGLGRTGTLFAYEQSGVEPDIMALAKPLAGGLPIGVAMLRQEVAQYLGSSPCDHASTFGGGPLVCSVAIKVFEKLSDPAFLAEIRAKGEHLHGRLNELKTRRSDQVLEIRGKGLIAGAVTAEPASTFVGPFLEKGIIVCSAGANVVRFIPPYIVGTDQIDEAVRAFEEILRDAKA